MAEIELLLFQQIPGNFPYSGRIKVLQYPPVGCQTFVDMRHLMLLLTVESVVIIITTAVAAKFLVAATLNDSSAL